MDNLGVSYANSVWNINTILKQSLEISDSIISKNSFFKNENILSPLVTVYYLIIKVSNSN